MAANLGNAAINVVANTANFEQSLRRSIKRVGAATAAIAVGVGLTNFLSSAIKDTVQLERQLAKVATIAGGDANMEKFFSPDTIRDFSDELGLATKDITEATYLALSSGTAAADSLGVVEAAGKTAIATASDLSLVVDFTTSALNAFGDSGVDAAEANDILFKALQYGKGTMNDFAKYISTAIPIADQLGVSLEQLASLGAVNTLTGSSARKVFTGLKVAMQELSDSTKNGGKAFKGLDNELKPAGETFQDYIKRTGDLAGAFAMLTKEVGGKNLTNIFGAKEGAAAIQSLATLQAKIPTVLQGVTQAQGAAKDAFDIVDKSLSRQTERLGVYWTNFKGRMGDALGPAAKTAIDGLIASMSGLETAVGATVGYIADRIDDIKAAWTQFSTAVANAQGSEAMARMREVLSNLWTTLQNVLPSLYTFITSVASVVGPVAGAIAVVAAVLATTLMPIVVIVIDSFLKLVNAFMANEDVIKTLTVVVITFIGVLWAQRAASYAVYLVAGLYYTAAALATIATGGWTTAFWLLNAAMAANPIGITVAIVAALAAGFIYAWKTSETFRNVVVKVLNVVMDAAVLAAGIMFRSFTFWIRGVLEAVKAAANAWAKLPKILGGGVASDISGAVNNILSGLSAIQRGIDGLKGKTITIGVQVTLEKFSAANADYGFNARAAELATGTGESIDSQMTDVKDQIKDALDFGGGGGNLDFGDGSGSGGITDKAKDAGKKAKDALKQALTQVKNDLDRIAKDTSKQTIDAIKSNFDALYEDLREAGGKKLIKGAEAVEKKLLSLAKKRDKLDLKLDTQRDKLEKLKDAWYETRDGIKAASISMGNITRDTGGIAVTFTGMRNNLRKAIATTKEYAANIRKLLALGLNRTSMEQILEAGPEAGATQARILAAGGKAAVSEINNLQATLSKEAGALGTDVSEKFFRQGIEMAKGLVKGLESEQAAIVKQMDKIADALVASIKKKLGIKSPSKVFAEVGENITKGLSVGILDAGALPGKAAATVSQSINFGPGSIVATGGTDPNRLGTGLGQGIVGVLEQRKVAAQLTGTG